MAERPSSPPHAPHAGGRRTMPAGRVLIVILVCLLTWSLLDAPSLKRSSEAQPLGTRRTVSLWVLTPLAAVSNVLQVTRLTDAVSSALGRDPNAAPGGVVAPNPDPLPTGGSPRPTQVPVKTEPLRTPTPARKLRVAVVGDSLASGLGVYLERVLKPSLTRVTKQGRISTGLARPDYFNWMAAMRQIMDGYRPDLVVVMIGENDNQGLLAPDGQLETAIGTFQWPQAYQQRVETFTQIAVDSGAHVVWVGLPIVADKKRWEVIRRQDAIFADVASQTPNTAYVDTWNRFAAPDGGYTAFYRNDGKVSLVRATDGVHFNGTGYQMVATAAIQAAIQAFDLTPDVLQSG